MRRLLSALLHPCGYQLPDGNPDRSVARKCAAMVGTFSFKVYADKALLPFSVNLRVSIRSLGERLPLVEVLMLREGR